MTTQPFEPERLYRVMIRRSGVAISPPESWALWQIAAHGPITAPALAGALLSALERRGYVGLDPQGVPALTRHGRRAFVALVRAGQEETGRLVRDWVRDERDRSEAMRRLTRAALRRVPGARSHHAAGTT
jgi:hypothetical protein